jgi:hypothetical protein
MKQISQGIGRTMMRSLIITVISTVIVVPLFCVLIIIPLGLYNQSDDNLWMLILGPLLFFLILNVGGISAAFFVIKRRNSRMDAIFTPLGLTGSAYNIFFRQYHGVLGGRNVSIYFYRGPVLEMIANSTLQTRMGVTRSTPAQIARWLGRETINVTGLLPEDISVHTMDENWFRRMVGEPGVRDLLDQLTGPQSFFVFRHVILAPGNLKLYFSGGTNLFNFQLDSAQTSAWVNDLLRLADLAERVPAPTRTDTESELEKMAHKMRKKSARSIWIAAAVVGGSVGCAAAIFVIAFLFAKYA